MPWLSIYIYNNNKEEFSYQQGNFFILCYFEAPCYSSYDEKLHGACHYSTFIHHSFLIWRCKFNCNKDLHIYQKKNHPSMSIFIIIPHRLPTWGCLRRVSLRACSPPLLHPTIAPMLIQCDTHLPKTNSAQHQQLSQQPHKPPQGHLYCWANNLINHLIFS